MSRKKTWEISDAFWELVEPLIPTDPRVANKTYQRQRGGGQETEIFQPPLLFGNSLRLTDWHHLEYLAPRKVWRAELLGTSR